MEPQVFLPGDLVKFSPYRSPVPTLPEIGIVVVSKRIAHAERGYVYEATTVNFGSVEYTFPATDFKLIRRL